MYTKDNQGYLTPANFAKSFHKARKNKQGVSRKYIYDLIELERKNPGSTDIDVFNVDGKMFCRYAKAKIGITKDSTSQL